MSANGSDANGRQIHRLEDDPNLQTLTPRSLAKNMAEIETLRSRVLELEQQLAKHQIEALTPTKTKLPPLTDAVFPSGGLYASQTNGAKSTSELRTIHSNDIASGRVATAPAATSRRISAGKSVDIATGERGPRDGKILAFVANSTDPDALDEVDLSIADCSGASPLYEETKITIGQDGEAVTIAVSQRNRLYQILKRLSTITSIPEDEVRCNKRRIRVFFNVMRRFATSSS